MTTDDHAIDTLPINETCQTQSFQGLLRDTLIGVLYQGSLKHHLSSWLKLLQVINRCIPAFETRNPMGPNQNLRCAEGPFLTQNLGINLRRATADKKSWM